MQFFLDTKRFAGFTSCKSYKQTRQNAVNDVALLQEQQRLCRRKHDVLDLLLVEGSTTILQVLLNIRGVKRLHQIEIPIVWKHLDELHITEDEA